MVLRRAAQSSTQLSQHPDLIDCLLALIASERGDNQHAITLFSGAITLRTSADQRAISLLQDRADAGVETARQCLSPPVFESAWDAGQAMSLAEVLDFGVAI